MVQDVSKLKEDTEEILSQAPDKLESEVQKLEQIQNAIEIKEQELKDIYEIKEYVTCIIRVIQKQWPTEKQKCEAEVKE